MKCNTGVLLALYSLRQCFCGCNLVGVATWPLYGGYGWGTNIWPLYGVAGWPFFRGSVTVCEVYVSSIRTRAFGRYIVEGGCCRGVTVMRGSTVARNIDLFSNRV